MASETGNRDQTTPESDTSVKRRGLLRFGTLVTAFTGASAISVINAGSGAAAPGDKNPPTTYVPMAEKGAPLGVATLDVESKIPPALLPDLSATFARKAEGRTFINMGKLPGAVGDGITDNTAVFQAALDNVGNGSPSTQFYFPPGVWLTDGLRPKSNCTLLGDGGGTFGLNSFNATRTSVLKLKPNARKPLIGDYAADNLSYGITIRDLALDGNKTNQTVALSAIELYPTGSGQDPLWRLERLHIHDFKGDGIKIGAYRRAAKIIDSEILNNDGHGINLGATDCTIRGVVIGQNGGNGIDITAGLQHIHGCDIFNNTNGVKIGPFGQGVMIDNCGIDINRRHGVTTEAPRVIITATNFQTNGTEANATYSHIDLGFPRTTSTNCVISAVAMRHDSTVSTNKAKYGIQTNVATSVSGIAYDPANVPWTSGLSGNPGLIVLAFRDQGFLDGVGIYMGNGGAGGGVRLGTASTQKMAFWGATPIVRPTMTNAAATDLATTMALVNELRSKLISLGLVQ